MKNNNKSIELQEAITKYIEWKIEDITSAERHYFPIMRAFEAFLSPDLLLDDLTGDHIVSYKKHMKRRGYSPATIALAMRVIRNFAYFWHGRRKIHFSPKEIIPPKFITPERSVATLEEFTRLSKVYDKKNIVDLQHKLVFHLLWDTGMRISELADLRISKLNMNHPEGIGTTTVGTKKAKQYNIVIWSAETNRLLKKYLKWRIAQSNQSDFLLVTTYRKSITGIDKRAICRWVQIGVFRARIRKHLTAHSFRHGKAHHILNNGGTVIDVQTALRHKSLKSSLHYMRLNDYQVVSRLGRFVQAIPEEHQRPSFMSEIAYNNRFGYTM